MHTLTLGAEYFYNSLGYADHDREAILYADLDPVAARAKKLVHCVGEYEITLRELARQRNLGREPLRREVARRWAGLDVDLARALAVTPASIAPRFGTVLAALRAEGAPLRGVVQAAAIFADAAAARQDSASFARVLAPKLAVAEALEALTIKDPLHLFLLFSSATTAFGNPGQA